MLPILSRKKVFISLKFNQWSRLLGLLLLGFSNLLLAQTRQCQDGMVLIESKRNSFQMGAENGNPDEIPIHQVSFTYNFYMDTTEVTQGGYHQLMQPTYTGYSQPLWGNPYGVGANYPVYAVEWGDAALYCNARSKQAGLDTIYVYTGISGRPGDGCSLDGLTLRFDANGYRLPTEAEWEYACRAGTTTDYFWGKNYNPYPETTQDTLEINNYTIWSVNAWDLSAEHADFGTHPVATKQPNGYGLYDMCGNVWEWIHDWYTDYPAEAQIDPKGTEAETYHFVRGGSWGNGATFLRSANRQFASPDYYVYFCGFRTVLPVKTTHVGLELTPEIPDEFTLAQNYPNPFNPTTQIQFSLARTATVSLTVYNAVGQQVTVLIDQQTRNAGVYTCDFSIAADANARRQANPLSSGVYFYKLTADKTVQVKKMILLQ